MSYIFVIITAILFTTHEPVSKLIANEINPYALTAIRFFIGSLICLPFSIHVIKKKNIKLTVKDILVTGGLGVLMICGSMVLLQNGVKIADNPALISILFSANSIFTIVLSTLFLKTKLTKLKVLGVILCVIGVILSMDIGSGSNALSITFAILSALIFSVYTILCKKISTKLTSIAQCGISFFVGSTVLMIILLICGIDIVGGITLGNLPELSFLSIIVVGGGYILFFSALDKGGPHVVALTYLIKPILTPFATWIFNGIVPKYTIIIAVILVAVGAAFSGGAIDNFLNSKKIKKA